MLEREKRIETVGVEDHGDEFDLESLVSYSQCNREPLEDFCR